MNDTPETTLFMIASLDGKISTGDSDDLDVDKDFPRIAGVREGLHQYYALEKHTDRVSLNSGTVLAKVGTNEKRWDAAPGDVSFVIIDNKPHLNKQGSEYFARRSDHLYLITTNSNHPAFALQAQYPTIHILFYGSDIDFTDAFRRLKNEFKIDKMTIQTGGTLNAQFLRLGLIDHISLVFAPCLIGGEATQGLIGGESLHAQSDLLNIRALRLTESKVLENSYLHVRYDVLNTTIIE